MKKLFAFAFCLSGCTLIGAFLQLPESEANLCNDNIDNDGDLVTDCDDLTDCGAEPGCQRATGEPCLENNHCLSAPGNQAICIPEEAGFPEGYCSEVCEASGVCFTGNTLAGAPADGVCVPTANLTLCLDQCQNDADCREGYSCLTVPIDQNSTPFSLCLPDCTRDEQCPLTGRCNLDNNRCTNTEEESVCDDGIDDDGDGFIDCADRGCRANPACKNIGEACDASTQCTPFQGNDGFCLTEDNFGFPDGYCVEVCDTEQNDCAPGAVCFKQGDDSNDTQGLCVDACQEDADCRPGYTCLDTDGRGPGETKICAPQCEAGSDCSATGRCNPDTGLCCNVDPNTRECVSFNSEACGNFADEDEDFRFDCGDLECSEDPACQPTQVVGAPCTGSVQCINPSSNNTENSVCLDEANTGFPGGYCSALCDPTDTTSCGGNTICVALDGVGLCLDFCLPLGNNCRAGYSCELVSAVLSACVPSCTDSSQCGITGNCVIDSEDERNGFCVFPE